MIYTDINYDFSQVHRIYPEVNYDLTQACRTHLFKNTAAPGGKGGLGGGVSVDSAAESKENAELASLLRDRVEMLS